MAEWLILQASHPVFEGDDVHLRCRGKNEEDINEKIYYRNKKEIGRRRGSKFTLHSVSQDNSEYHCTASGESFWRSWEKTSKPLKIQVQGNGYNPVGNWSWQGNCVGIKEGVLISGDFMRGLFQASMGRRWEVVPSPWVPTSRHCAENTGISVQELGVSLPWELSFFFSLELFPRPVLRVSTSQPIEGSPMNLKCETWLPPLRSHIELQFCFFREDKVLGSGWSSSPELQIPTMWSEDSGSYSCQANAVTPNIIKISLRSWISVQSECLWGSFSRVRAGSSLLLLPEITNMAERSCQPSHYSRCPCYLRMGTVVCGDRYCSLRDNVHNQFLISLLRPLPIAPVAFGLLLAIRAFSLALQHLRLRPSQVLLCLPRDPCV